MKTGTQPDMVAIEQIVLRVHAAPKYRRVCLETVQRVAAESWARYGAFKAALQATQAQLHQVYGAYEQPMDYARAWAELEAAQHDQERLHRVYLELLARHASTRERLNILEHFYAGIFSRTGIPRSVLDLACGLGPLSLPWMGLPAGAVYHAYDIDAARVEFLGRYLAWSGAAGQAHLQDILCHPPQEAADVALLLKSAPCLEQQEKGSTLRLLHHLRAAWVVVSFPTSSLGRRDKGMPAHYEQVMRQMLDGLAWPVTRLEFAGELVFIVQKG